MKLTPRATAFLQTLRRDPEWVTERDETMRYLDSLKIPYTPEFVQAQLDLSGYVLKERNDDHSTSPCRIRIISKEHIQKHKKIRLEYFGDKVMTDFITGDYYGGDWYYIATNGQLCVKDDESGKTKLIFDSANAIIELAALRNEYSYFTKVEQATRGKIRDLEAFLKVMESLDELEFMGECSGTQDYLWKNELAMVYAYLWEEPDWFALEISGVDPDYCMSLARKLDGFGVTH